MCQWRRTAEKARRLAEMTCWFSESPRILHNRQNLAFLLERCGCRPARCPNVRVANFLRNRGQARAPDDVRWEATCAPGRCHHRQYACSWGRLRRSALGLSNGGQRGSVACAVRQFADYCNCGSSRRHDHGYPTWRSRHGGHDHGYPTWRSRIGRGKRRHYVCGAFAA